MRLAALALALTACGGGDNTAAHFLLVMQTVTHELEAVYAYDSEHDCVGAGSYRVAAHPEKYIGFSCKET